MVAQRKELEGEMELKAKQNDLRDALITRQQSFGFDKQLRVVSLLTTSCVMNNHSLA